MAQVLQEQKRLLVKGMLNFQRGLVVAPQEMQGVKKPHQTGRLVFFGAQQFGFLVERGDKLLVGIKGVEALPEFFLALSDASVDFTSLFSAVLILVIKSHSVCR